MHQSKNSICIVSFYGFILHVFHVLMSFSDYNCSLNMEPVSLLFLFCSSIARKRSQLGRRGKQVPLLPHEAELLARVGEDEITQLLAHQDCIQAQRRRRRRAEEHESSTSSTCSVIQSEGETQEEAAEAATPTSAEAEQEVEETCPVEAAGDAEDGEQTRQIQGVKSSSFTSTRWTKAWTCPRLVGLTVIPPHRFLRRMFSSTLHYPPTWTHPLVPPPQCVLVRILNLLQYTSPSSTTCECVSAAHCEGPRETICRKHEAMSLFGPQQSPAAPSLCGSGELPMQP
ncbi:uncharacterized protein [Aquarana catesbeiana]|uniref:uncharacterized protein n=1 Tax=Aquarana catesbeiana TaxID=8400 RepID=UPI003CC966BE